MLRSIKSQWKRLADNQNKNAKRRPGSARKSSGSRDFEFARLESRQLMIGDLVHAYGGGGNLTDVGKSVAVDGSGNTITTGYFEGTMELGDNAVILSSAGARDIFIVKYDNNGHIAWGKRIGSTSIDEGHSVVTDPSGNIYVGGSFQGTVDFDPGSTVSNLTSQSTDAFIVKLNSSGNFVWARKMGGTGVDILTSLALDNSGNIHSTGTFFRKADFDPSPTTSHVLTSNGDGVDVFVSKLNSDGNFVWARNVGNAENEFAVSIDTDSSGNVYAAGQFSGKVDFDPGAGLAILGSVVGGEGFALKLNSAGNYVWAKQLGGNVEGIDVGASVTVTGSFVGTRDFDPSSTINNKTSTGGNDVFVTQLLPDGRFNWTKTFGGLDHDIGKSVRVDSAGDVYVLGSYKATFDFGDRLSSRGLTDIFTLKLNRDGETFHWARSQGGTDVDMPEEMVLDQSGNIYSTGYFYGNARFDTSEGTFSLWSRGASDFYVSKLTQEILFYEKYSNHWSLRKNGSNLEIFNHESGATVVSRRAEHVLGVEVLCVDENHRLVINWAFGGPFSLRNGVRFIGAVGNDQLIFVGTGEESVTYKSLLTVPGGSSNVSVRAFGTVELNIRTDLTERVKVSRAASLTYETPFGQDVVIGQNAFGYGTTTGTELSGTSDGIRLNPLVFDNVPNVSVDLGVNDAATFSDDRMRFNGPIGARGLQSLNVITGVGADALTVNNADLRLDLLGGEFRFDGGLGSDRLLVTGDTNWRLNDARLESTAGGRIAFSGLEAATIIGGEGNNDITAVGFSGSVVLDGQGGNDVLRGTNQSDYIAGGTGRDRIFAGKGNDQIYGGSLFGDTEEDTIYFDGVDTAVADDIHMQYLTSTSARFNRRVRGSSTIVEQDNLAYDASDRIEIRALDGDDLINVDLAFAISGLVNGGAGSDTCNAPSSWTKISC